MPPERIQLIEARLNVIRELTKTFRLERLMYLIMTLVALLTILATAAWALVNRQLETAQSMLLTGGSAGLVALISQILKMWTRSMEAVLQSVSPPEEGASNE